MSALSFDEALAEDSAIPASQRKSLISLADYFTQICDEQPDATALVCGTTRLTYRELDEQANRAARLLRTKGIRKGEVVGILLERSPALYVTLLAIIKAGAVFVPLDPAFPAARVAFIARDADLRAVVTSSTLRSATEELPCEVLEFDLLAEELEEQPEWSLAWRGNVDDWCYIIYTSGSTGQPKGVAISHASVVNYFQVTAPILRVTAEDRVYQGTTITFDVSLEEMWFTWLARATLVAGPAGSQLLGHELAEFLNEQEITVLFCVPTLLETLNCDVPSLRLIEVGGEACPAHLVRQWAREGRRIVNSYGPTEATIAATCGELSPERPVTIGSPLPTYEVFLLDERLHPVAPEEPGEICIAGPGVATGYVKRPDLTRERFIPNPCACGSSLLYRTGDLGRWTPSGEIEYLGRLDMQMKIRGYRIEPGEIEALLVADEAVEQACVAPVAQDGAIQDLAAYIILHKTTRVASTAEALERLRATLRNRLPVYMVPAFIEVLDAFPRTVSGKVDRVRLPRPAGPRAGGQTKSYVAPASELERRLAARWAEALGVEKVSREDDFFQDLGGHSLTAARVISRLRQEAGWQELALGDLYRHSTIRQLANFIETQSTPDTPAQTEAAAPRIYTRRRILGCGVLQLTIAYAFVLLAALPVMGLPSALGSPWRLALLGVLQIAWLAVLGVLLPVTLGRWLLKGLTAGKYPLWGGVYLRCWLHNALLATSPLSSLAGTPLCSLYLRMLGAKVGKACHLASTQMSLVLFLNLDDEVSLGYGARLEPGLVENGWLRIAPVRLGHGVFVGANSVVRPGATVGERTTIAEQSLLAQDQSVPAHEHWGGSPLERLETPAPALAALIARVDRRRWPPGVCLGFVGGIALCRLLPWLALAPGVLLIVGMTLRAGPLWGLTSTLLAGPLFVLMTCALVIVGKRCVMSRSRPGVYPLRSWFGLRKWLCDQFIGMSLSWTNTLYGTLYVIPFLRLLGAKIGAWCEVSTVSYIDPDMLTLTGESFVADIAVVGAAIFHNGWLALTPSVVGQRSFVGNGALLSGPSHLDDRSLVGVHSMSTMRHIAPETVWLGSPAALLPRREPSAHFDEALTYRPRPAQVLLRLFIEFFRVTLPPILAGLLVWEMFFALLGLCTMLTPLTLLLLTPGLALAGSLTVLLVVVGLKWLLVGRYRSRVDPLWSGFVRRSELITGLYEGLIVPVLIAGLRGTPWIAPCLRLFGARIGRRVWLDTTHLSEFDLVEVGDDAAIGHATSLQTHLFEDRVMKMAPVKIGQASSVGSRSVVLYNAEVGRAASLDALSLVMKGETLPARSRWRGIPARASKETQYATG